MKIVWNAFTYNVVSCFYTQKNQEEQAVMHGEYLVGTSVPLPCLDTMSRLPL
jgi:hypothetical protein